MSDPIVIIVVEEEKAIIEALRAAIALEGRRLTVETYEGEMDERSIADFKKIAPFILVSCVGSTSQQKAQFAAGLVEREFRLLVGSVNLRSTKDAKFGAYELLHKAKSALTTSVLTLENGRKLKPLSWQGEYLKFRIGGMIVYEQVYTLSDLS
jgi:phage gp37-like protein